MVRITWLALPTRRITWRAAAAAITLMATSVQAQEWPTRPVRIVVPYPAGGAVDIVTRALADPQAVHRGVRIRAGGGALGPVEMVGSPIRIDGARQDAELPPPGLGEHGDLLTEWVSAEELEKLKAAGIVG